MSQLLIENNARELDSDLESVDFEVEHQLDMVGMPTKRKIRRQRISSSRRLELIQKIHCQQNTIKETAVEMGIGYSTAKRIVK